MAMISLALVLAALTGADAFKSSGRPYPVNKPYDQKFEDRYSPLKVMGGRGPYSARSGEGISTDIPAGCEVDQVVLLQRHGERYPSASDAKTERAALKKIYEDHPEPFTGDLEFLNTWEYFLGDTDAMAGLMMMSGPYSGLADLDGKGSIFFNRYGHLWDGESGIPLFASGSERVIQSARSWGRGFAGYNYSDIIEINVVSEKKKAGGNSLSPDYCAYDVTTECELPAGVDDVTDIVYPEFDEAAIRLNTEYGLTLTGSDMVALFDIAGFDVAARGDSPWLNVFTREEWKAYEYLKSLRFYCNSGAGSKQARAFGTNLANATTFALNQGPEDSGLPFVLNFLHDTDISSYLGGLGILNPVKKINTSRVMFGTGWDVSDIVPMGAHLTIERLQCDAPGLTNSSNFISVNSTLPDSYLNASYGQPSYTNTSYFSPNYTNSSAAYGFNITNGTTNGQAAQKSYFVRVLLNEAVVPLDFCYGGPGYSCSLEDWIAHVAQCVQEDNYNTTCQPAEKGYPEYFDAYWNYNKSTAWDSTDVVYAQGKPLS